VEAEIFVHSAEEGKVRGEDRECYDPAKQGDPVDG
jgi:hypothetical protein